MAGSAFFAIGVLGLLYIATHAETTLNLWLGVAEAAAGLVAVRAVLAAQLEPLLRVLPPAAVLTAAGIRCCTWTHVRHP